MTFSNIMIWPMIAHAFLVFGLYYLLSSRRIGAVRAGTAKAEQFKENRDEPLESLLTTTSRTSSSSRCSSMWCAWRSI